MEIIFYACNFIVFYFILVPTVGASVREKCEGLPPCDKFLKRTWMGYRVDLADDQWREMRGSLVLLWVCMLFITSMHYVVKSVFWVGGDKNGGQTGQASATVSAWFRMFIGLVFLLVQHGKHSLVVLLISYLGYRLAVWQREAKLRNCAVTWLYALAVLLFKESYRIKNMPGFHFLRPVFDHRHGGMYGWQLPANFLVLRIISFSLDLQWAGRVADDKIDDTSGDSADRQRLPHLSPSSSPGSTPRRRAASSKQRMDGIREGSAAETRVVARIDIPPATSAEEMHRPLEQYNLVNYLAYMLYAPLYTAGPVISFNAFVENTHNPQKSEDPLIYGLRWLICLAIMELLTSWFPFFATIRSWLYPHLSPAELAVVAYVVLKMMWLKFLIIWRFFRLWAMADGTLAPENMQRCMSNNCSLEQFWKGWHSSFNRWIVRYMYKPLGGRESRLWSVWPIFLFVAVWHDIEMKLLIWGLLNAFFFVLEVLAKRLAASAVFQSLPSMMFKLICVLSGATYILVLVAVNLAGYSVGVGGVNRMLQTLVSWDGLLVVFCSYYFLSVAVSFMSFLQRIGLSKS